MAKTNMRTWLDYFPFDCKPSPQLEIIEAEFGAAGFMVLVKLLMQIYGGAGYYTVWNKDAVIMFSRRCLIKRELVKAIVDTAIARGVFSEAHYRSHKILTSLEIQQRYVEAKMRAKRVVMENRYLLLEKERLPKNVYIIDNDVYIYPKNDDTFSQRERETERETETETEKEREIETETAPAKVRTTKAPKAPKAAARHTPALSQIEAYAKQKGFTHVNCQKFFLYYEATGWKNVADWRAQLARWELEDAERANAANTKARGELVDPYEYDMEELERILSGEYDDE